MLSGESNRMDSEKNEEKKKNGLTHFNFVFFFFMSHSKALYIFSVPDFDSTVKLFLSFRSFVFISARFFVSLRIIVLSSVRVSQCEFNCLCHSVAGEHMENVLKKAPNERSMAEKRKEQKKKNESNRVLGVLCDVAVIVVSRIEVSY